MYSLITTRSGANELSDQFDGDEGVVPARNINALLGLQPYASSPMATSLTPKLRT